MKIFTAYPLPLAFLLLALSGCGGGSSGDAGSGFLDENLFDLSGGGSSGPSGAKLYKDLCQTCHGTKGDGTDGSTGVPLTSPPANLSAYIAGNMPEDDPGLCVGACASATADFIRKNFVDSGNVTGSSQPEEGGYAASDCSTIVGGVNALEWFIANGTTLRANTSLAGAGDWQLIFQKNATVHSWADPDFAGWNKRLESSCQENAEQPVRILLDVNTPPPYPMPIVLADQIDQVITVIQQKYPGVREIILLDLDSTEPGSSCDDTLLTTTDDAVLAALDMFPEHASTEVEILREFAPWSLFCTDGPR